MKPSVEQQRTVALVGNPNSGKTTLFNALTGASQKVGNYPGVTVERISGEIKIGSRRVEVIDVPGLYSLQAISDDERVALGVLESSPDLVVCVVDAPNLERNLFLLSQLAERGIPLMVAMTMTDFLEKAGDRIDLSRLSNLLGVEVTAVVAHKSRGVRDLVDAIDRNLSQPRRSTIPSFRPDAITLRASSIRERLLRIGLDVRQTEIADAISGSSNELLARLDAYPEIAAEIVAARENRDAVVSGDAHADAAERYAWASMVARACLSAGGRGVRSVSDRVDQILTHRVFGFAIFVGIMYLVFQSIYTLAEPAMDGIQFCSQKLGDWVAPMLSRWPVVQSAVVDGLIAGIGSVMVFLPQIVILFFFIAVLEGSGYLARAAFMMDRLLGWCGLNGRAFIPLLSSFACAIPGIMAARVIPDSRSRLATILVAPLMSCSARLPVYLLMIGAFIEPRFGPAWAGFALFAMHFLGLLIAIPVVWILNRGVLKGKRLPFLLELPPYQWPKWRDVFLAMYLRGKVFVTIAGTTIVAMSIIIWALLYFPRSDARVQQYRSEFRGAVASARPDLSEESYVEMRQIEDSYLGRFGKTIEPAFRPAGFDWRISTAILAAFPAREVVVPSLGIIFSLGKNQDEASMDLRKALMTAKRPDGSPLLTTYTAVGVMVFFALCAQCFSTLAIAKRETNSVWWPLFMFGYMSTLAYLGACFVHLLERMFG